MIQNFESVFTLRKGYLSTTGIANTSTNEYGYTEQEFAEVTRYC